MVLGLPKNGMPKKWSKSVQKVIKKGFGKKSPTITSVKPKVGSLNIRRKTQDSVIKSADKAIQKRNLTKEQGVAVKKTIAPGLKKISKTQDDIDRLKANTKVTRIPRAKKPKASDKQIEKLNYKVDDTDAKLVSINPIMIPGKNKLFVYNTKNTVLHVYENDSTAGFEVKGSTVYNWNDTSSMCTTLRKPDDVLPQILTKTEKQIEKVLSSLTTKKKKPTGRINKDCILLRVL